MTSTRSFFSRAAILSAQRITVVAIFSAIAAAPAPNVTAPRSAPRPISMAISTAIWAMNQPISSHALLTESIMLRAKPPIDDADSRDLAEGGRERPLAREHALLLRQGHRRHVREPGVDLALDAGDVARQRVPRRLGVAELAGVGVGKHDADLRECVLEELAEFAERCLRALAQRGRHARRWLADGRRRLGEARRRGRLERTDQLGAVVGTGRIAERGVDDLERVRDAERALEHVDRVPVVAGLAVLTVREDLRRLLVAGHAAGRRERGLAGAHRLAERVGDAVEAVAVGHQTCRIKLNRSHRGSLFVDAV